MASKIDNLRLQELAHRYLQGKLDAAEQLEFDQWFNKTGEVPFFVPEGTAASEKDYELALFARIEKQIHNARPRTYRLWLRYAAAASILVILGVGGYLYRSSLSIQSAATVADIAPGTNGATLTLASGRKITLASAANGELAKEAGIAISKTASGEIVYKVSGDGTKTAENPSAYNTLSTANGETYSVVLPDGSKVWLNAASSLRYPTSFASHKERRVELDGEGYFEIAKVYTTGSQAHRIPFIVKTASQEVEVLGTHFNINAYTDEPGIRTTLLEGSVNVRLLSSPSAGQRGVRLRPGQQAINHKNATAPNQFSIAEVDPQKTIDWKNGDFIFKTDDFKSIMRKIARWYNVEILYAPDAPTNLALGGLVSRSKNISAILKIMEETGDVHFKVSDGIKGKGRRITVTR